MKYIVVAAVVLGISVILQACDGSGSSPSPSPSPTPSPANNMFAVAEGDANLSTFVTALKAAGLVDFLSGKLPGAGPFTVFAPNNDAFDALPNGGAALTFLLHNRYQLMEVLEFHVHSGGVIESDQLKNDEEIPMFSGGNVTVYKNSSNSSTSVTIEGGSKGNATVIKADIEASNGVMHIIDKVLLPRNMNFSAFSILALSGKSPEFSTFIKAVGTAGLESALSLGPLTVFLPTDAAFDSLNAKCSCLPALLQDQAKLTQVLTYHVLNQEYTAAQLISGGNKSYSTSEGKAVNITIVDVEGEGISVIVNDATATQPVRPFASNGVVHVIDKILLPPDFVLPTPTRAAVTLV